MRRARMGLAAGQASAFLVLALTLVFPVRVTAEAPWVAADWGEAEPSFPPGSLFWHTNVFKQGPILYRTVFEVPQFAGEPLLGEPYCRAVIRARADGWIDLYLDGKLLGGAPEGNQPQDGLQLDVVLPDALSPGPHTLVVSAPSGGFSLETVLHYFTGEEQRRVPATGDWRVMKFEPLTIAALLPCHRPDFDASAWKPVKPGQGPSASLSEDDFWAAFRPVELQRARARLDEVKWRADLLKRKGIVLVEDEAYGFGGRGRLPAEVLSRAEEAERRAQEALAALDRGDEMPGGRAAALAQVEAAANWIEATSWVAYLADETLNLRNRTRALKTLGGESAEPLRPLISDGESLGKGLTAEPAESTKLRVLLASCRGWRTKREALRPFTPALNHAVANPVGWIDANLLGNDIGAWGLRLTAERETGALSLDGKWRFRLDPANAGLKESWQSAEHPAAAQWVEINVPGSWEEQGYQDTNPDAVAQTPYPGVNERTDGPYNGWGWYRRSVTVPERWAGHDLQLRISVIDDWDWAYLNGVEIGHTGADTPDWWRVPRTYTIPAKLVRAGEANEVVLHVYDCGAGEQVGSVQLACPELEQQLAGQAAAAEAQAPEVYASPLSVGCLITPRGDTLTLTGWADTGSPGPRALLLPLAGGPEARTLEPTDEDGELYFSADVDGDLKENWVVLWLDEREGSDDQPIELVLTAKPRTISVVANKAGVSRVDLRFGRPAAPVVAVRPVGGAGPLDADAPQPHILGAVGFYAGALLRYPTSYSETVVRDEAQPDRLRVCDVYDHRSLPTDWNMRPVLTAPLPPLASYGLKCEMPGLEVLSKTIDANIGLGRWGRHQLAVNQDHIEYTVPAPRLPRFAGFTSFCFSGADVGVPGNLKELETIKVTGANSFRPQHNQNGELAKRLVEWCQAAGLNHVFNIDNTLGNSDAVYEHYRVLAEMCKDLPPEAVTYDLINEPANMPPEVYNPVIKKLTGIIREIDRTHLIYVETPASYAAVGQFANLQPTGDPLTVYSFHSYDYRLPPRWPNAETDVRDLLAKWVPAFAFAIENDATLGLGEFGGFEQTKNDPFTNRSTVTLLMDYFDIFDQFGWHHHYYANRGIVRVRMDGTIQESLVQEAYRRYFGRGGFEALSRLRTVQPAGMGQP